MKTKAPKRNEQEDLNAHLDGFTDSSQNEASVKIKPKKLSAEEKAIQNEIEILNQFKAADPIVDFAKKYNCAEEDVVKMISEWKKKNRR